MEQRGQAGVEYLIIIGFVAFATIGILSLAYIYSGLSNDQIRLNQAENFAVKLINSAESVFFAGEPSETTISLYLPEGVQDVNISSGGVLLTVSTSTGKNVRFFTSRVPLQGTLSSSSGIKTVSLRALEDHILIE
ncbi:MAG: hypothetical protein ABIF88_00185 [archaeon]